MIDSINNMYPELNDCREVIVKELLKEKINLVATLEKKVKRI